MNKTFKVGQRDTIKLSASNPKGLRFNFIVQHDSNNTPVAAAAVDMSKIDVRIVLHRDSQSETLMSGNLEVLSKFLLYLDPEYEYIENTAGVPLVAHGTTVKGVNLLPITLPFSSVLNLRGSDVLDIDIDFKDTALAAAYSSTGTSLQVSEIEGIGLEYLTPVVTASTIEQGQSQIRKDLGDNILSMAFINLDKTGNTNAAQVLTNFEVKHSKGGDTRRRFEMISDRLKQFPTTAEANSRSQSYLLIKGDTDIDEVRVLMDLDPTNVNIGQNYICTLSFKSNVRTMQKAVVRSEKHRAKAEMKFTNSVRSSGMRRKV
jgi:hypothetical protein